MKPNNTAAAVIIGATVLACFVLLGYAMAAKAEEPKEPPVREVYREQEVISPAPANITISWDWLNYLLDTEVLAQDSVRSLQSCRRALKKEKAKKVRR